MNFKLVVQYNIILNKDPKLIYRFLTTPKEARILVIWESFIPPFNEQYSMPHCSVTGAFKHDRIAGQGFQTGFWGISFRKSVIC
jgi:hypothetical protein